jgi:hypothetical protein
MKFTNGATRQFIFLAKMIKGCGILAAARKLDDPKSIRTDPELARQFCECTAEMDCQCHGMDAECLEALLTYDAKDQKRGILSVLESYAKGKCIIFELSSLHFEHSHSSDVIHSQVKRSNYYSAAEQCENLKAEQDKCHSEIIELSEKCSEIEGQRVKVVAAKANIDHMPDIVEDRRQIEQARAHVDTLESKLNDKKALRESCYNEKILELDERAHHCTEEIEKEAGEFKAKGATLAKNEKIREAAKKDKDHFDATSVHYHLATARSKESILQHGNIVQQLSAVFNSAIESILDDEENPIDRFFAYEFGDDVKENFMSVPAATKLLRLLKNIGWEQSPEFNAKNTKLIVARKRYKDGGVESSGEMVLRLMQTIFAGGELPQSGKDLLYQLNQKKEVEIKAKAREEEMEGKKLKSAPDSTQKRSLYDINPTASECYSYVERSAKKRRITGTEEDTWAEFSNLAGCEETRKFVCETPPRRPSSSDDIDSFSVNSELAGTGLSKEYKCNL